jgi:hypothetical protein
MATTYRKQLGGGKVQIHENANATITVVGNNTVSNLTSNSTEVVAAGVITKVWYGADAGSWQLRRGNSTVNAVVGVFSGTGRADFDEGGTLLDMSPTGTNLYLTLNGAANGYIIVEMKKTSSFS